MPGRKPTGKPPGRPPIPINWEEFDKLCALQCLQTEIAAWFNCTVDTLENRVKSEKGMGYSEYYHQKADKGKIALRRVQWQLALKGDKTMLIWLGKQCLGQSEKVEEKIQAQVTGNVIHDTLGGDGKPLDS